MSLGSLGMIDLALALQVYIIDLGIHFTFDLGPMILRTRCKRRDIAYCSIRGFDNVEIDSFRSNKVGIRK